jgi:hypothetical protein
MAANPKGLDLGGAREDSRRTDLLPAVGKG